MKSMVTGKNQVSIPAAVARKRGIKPGYQIEWIETDKEDEVLLRIIPDRATLARKLQGAGLKWMRPEADPIGDLIRERARDMEEEEQP